MFLQDPMEQKSCLEFVIYFSKQSFQWSQERCKVDFEKRVRAANNIKDGDLFYLESHDGTTIK